MRWAIYYLELLRTGNISIPKSENMTIFVPTHVRTEQANELLSDENFKHENYLIHEYSNKYNI